MSAKWKKGQVCWFIRGCDGIPAVQKGRVTSSVYANTARVRWGLGVNAATSTVIDIDMFGTEEEACRKLVERLQFEIALLEHRITDIRYEQGPMEVSK